MGDERDIEGFDRHCFRPTRSGIMKCRRCYDYNRGVMYGVCSVCKFNRFDVDMVSDVCNPNRKDSVHCPEALDLEFEECIQLNKWTDSEVRAAASNTDKIFHLVNKMFGGGAAVHKEGSVRKNTAIQISDVDLMVTLKGRRQMTDNERDCLVRNLQALIDGTTGAYMFQQVKVGLHAIKATPMKGPRIDIVAHHSNFKLSPRAQNYLKPAGKTFWGLPAATLAVSGMKVWWHSVSKTNKIPGYIWEELVVHIEKDILREAARDQDMFTVKSGLAYFLQTMTVLATTRPQHLQQPQSETPWWRRYAEATYATFEWTPAREKFLHRVCKAAQHAVELWEDNHDLCTAFGF